MGITNNKEIQVENILTLADKLFRQLLPTVPKDLIAMDVTMPQLKIMLILYVHGPTRMSDIASELDVTLPTATSLVERLVEKNYVLRESQPNDRRVVLCCLSESGQEAIGRIWQSSKKRSTEILEAMDASKLELFVEALQAMYETALAENKVAEQS
jgi:DNA-binding MarR family transcriptional regulator